MLDLTTYSFPEISDEEMAFPIINTDKTLLAEAQDRGFDNWNNPYHKLFSNIFFSGGSVKFKPGLDEGFADRAWRYCMALMRSFSPKHEHKSAVCAMLMSELLELEPHPVA